MAAKRPRRQAQSQVSTMVPKPSGPDPAAMFAGMRAQSAQARQRGRGGGRQVPAQPQQQMDLRPIQAMLGDISQQKSQQKSQQRSFEAQAALQRKSQQFQHQEAEAQRSYAEGLRADEVAERKAAREKELRVGRFAEIIGELGSEYGALMGFQTSLLRDVAVQGATNRDDYNPDQLALMDSWLDLVYEPRSVLDAIDPERKARLRTEFLAGTIGETELAGEVHAELFERLSPEEAAIAVAARAAIPLAKKGREYDAARGSIANVSRQITERIHMVEREAAEVAQAIPLALGSKNDQLVDSENFGASIPIVGDDFPLARERAAKFLVGKLGVPQEEGWNQGAALEFYNEQYGIEGGTRLMGLLSHYLDPEAYSLRGQASREPFNPASGEPLGSWLALAGFLEAVGDDDFTAKELNKHTDLHLSNRMVEDVNRRFSFLRFDMGVMRRRARAEAVKLPAQLRAAKEQLKQISFDPSVISRESAMRDVREGLDLSLTTSAPRPEDLIGVVTEEFIDNPEMFTVRPLQTPLNDMFDEYQEKGRASMENWQDWGGDTIQTIKGAFDQMGGAIHGASQAITGGVDPLPGMRPTTLGGEAYPVTPTVPQQQPLAPSAPPDMPLMTTPIGNAPAIPPLPPWALSTEPDRIGGP